MSADDTSALSIPDAATPDNPFRELAGLGFILLVYVILFQAMVGYAVDETILMVVTNGWLLVGVMVYLRRSPLRAMSLPKLSFVLISMLWLCAFTALRWTSEREFAFLARDRMAPTVLLIFAVPFAEEVYYRGILLDHLCFHTNRVVAVLLVSLLFGLMHLPQANCVAMILVSLVLCVLTLYTRQLGWAMALHGAWNLLLAYR